MAVLKLKQREVSRQTADPATLRALYMSNETAPEVLRVEIDHLQRLLSKLELQHKTDASNMERLVLTKHDSVGEALSSIRARLAAIERSMDAVYGNPLRADDVGLVGEHKVQLSKVWKKLDQATTERWKIRLALAASGGGAALTLAQLFGLM